VGGSGKAAHYRNGRRVRDREGKEHGEGDDGNGDQEGLHCRTNFEREVPPPPTALT